MLDSLGVARYRTIRRVGSGGMGELYEVWDDVLERRVAVKRLHPHVVARPDGAQLILHEARSAARIEHPNVVRIYGVERSGSELLIEMQFIEGRPLNDLLKGFPLPVDLAADLLRQILEGLAACHAHGVIHRDLKPANVLVDATGNVYLTDFGIAQVLRTEVDDNASVPAWGTPRFTPPEAWAGGFPTPLWDLYAAGIILREALSGAPPFDGDTVADIRDQVADGVKGSVRQDRPDISDAFAALIDSLTAKNPSDRPENARAALRQLRLTPEYEIAAESTRGSSRRVQTSVTGRRRDHAASPSKQTPPPSSRQRSASFIAFVILLLSLTASYLYLKSKATEKNVPEVISESKPGNTASPAIAANAAAVALPVNEPRFIGTIGKSFYMAYDDHEHGEELWGIVDLEEPILLEDIAPGPESSYPRAFHAIEGRHYFFRATSPRHGEELWLNYDSGSGEFVKPFMVIDLWPGAMGSSPEAVFNCDSMLYFFATTRAYGRELWRTMGSAPQTALLADIFQGKFDSVVPGPRIYSSDHGFYWTARSDANKGNFELYYLDCAKDELTDIGPSDFASTSFTQLHGTLFLLGSDPEHGEELWSHDPATGNYGLAVDIIPGPESSSPGFLATFKDLILFRANNAEFGIELYRSDGTAEGTWMVKDLNPGEASGNPFAFVDMGDVVVFRATTDATGMELWYTDGTPEGTGLISDIFPGPRSSEPYNTVRFGTKLFFTALDEQHGEELWVTERVGSTWNTRLVQDLREGSKSSYPNCLIFNNEGIGMFTAEISETEGWLHRLSVEGDTIGIQIMPRITPGNARTL